MNEKEIEITDGIRQFYVPKLNTISKSGVGSLRSWLALSDNFIPVDRSIDDTFELIFYDLSEFLSYVASDITRLSCASIESLNNIFEAKQSKKFLAWEIVKYYYSAFYSAHSTLKACGLGLVQIDQRIAQNIIRRSSTLGVPPPKINRGIYCFSIDCSSMKAVFFKVQKYDDSHKGLWQRYTDFIDLLIGLSIETSEYNSNCIIHNDTGAKPSKCIYSQLPIEEAEAIISRLGIIKKIINKRGDSNWLSSVRNMVNYNHDFGVWFPYSDYNDKHSSIVGLKNLYLFSPLSDQFLIDSSTVLTEFVLCCQLVNSINYAVLCDLVRRHPNNRSFLLNGPIAYLKQSKQIQ